MHFWFFKIMQTYMGFLIFAVLILGVFSSNLVFGQTLPIAEDDFYSVDEDSVLSVEPVGILHNDTNTQNAGTFLAIIKTSTGFGTLNLNPDGSFTYQPNLNFDSTDSFTYVANDGTSNSTQATVTIEINPINDAPIALNDTYTISEDSFLAITSPGILINDYDVDGDSLFAIIDTTTNNGILSVNSNGSFSYIPDANFAGLDSFTYLVNDGSVNSNVATVNITIVPENDAPIAQDDFAETQQNIPVIIDVLKNDFDAENDSLDVIVSSDASQTAGTVELEDGKILFTPKLNFVGNTTFSYAVSDGNATSNSAQVYVVVTEAGSSNDSIINRIFKQIQLLIDKIKNLEDEITKLKEENSALSSRITKLESLIENNNSIIKDNNNTDGKIQVCHKDKKTIYISENHLSGHLKHGDSLGPCSFDDLSSEKEIKNKIKALKKEFKEHEKELKKQLKELKKDKKHEDDD